MEEKKLNDELLDNTIRALDCLSTMGECGVCGDCNYFTGNGFEECVKSVACGSVDLIHRLQSEKAEKDKYIEYLKRKLNQANVTYRSKL